VLLSEIGRKPSSDKSTDREGYSLAAGVALGMVTLGRGSDAVGLGDLEIENRLGQFMVGGREGLSKGEDSRGSNQNQLNKCSCIKEGDMVRLFDIFLPAF
jgi:anaphase-promoting complex subunit 1